VKEIAEIENEDIDNSQVMRSLNEKPHKIFEGEENAPPR
jgi:hypothetical protein